MVDIAPNINRFISSLSMTEGKTIDAKVTKAISENISDNLSNCL